MCERSLKRRRCDGRLDAARRCGLVTSQSHPRHSMFTLAAPNAHRENPRSTRMLDEIADPATDAALEFSRHLLASLSEREAARVTANVHEFWQDGASAWTNLLNVEHWIER